MSDDQRPFQLLVDGVGKSYGDRRVLADFELTVANGESVAITGPSGSGKSTALNIAGLITTPTVGRVVINGCELTTAADADRTHNRGRNISFVYQGFHLAASLTVRENVELGVLSQLSGVQNVEARALSALDAVGVSHLSTAYPATLSGGEQQRVAIARAFARRTPLLLADEPTGNLDETNTELVLGLMHRHVHEGGALVVVTHDNAVAATADRIIALRPVAEASR